MSLSQEEKQHFLSSITFPLIFVIIMWTVKIIETVFYLDFSILGVKPLSVEGLPGIILFHFIHGDWKHLIANTLPILVLGTLLFYFYRSIAVKISLLLMIITGIFVWFGARDGVHIGASAMIYGLAFFLMVSGFIRHNKALTALSFIVVFLYGGLVWGLYPKYAIYHNISWEGHLGGFVTGIALAIFYRHEGEQNDENQWDDEDDDDTDDGDHPYWDIPEPDPDELTVRYHPKRR